MYDQFDEIPFHLKHIMMTAYDFERIKTSSLLKPHTLLCKLQKLNYKYMEEGGVAAAVKNQDIRQGKNKKIYLIVQSCV